MAGEHMAKRRERDGEIPIWPSRRTLVIVAVAVVTGAIWLYLAVRPDDFVVTGGELETAAPRMLRTFGSYQGPTPCEAGIVCETPTCRSAHGSTPFTYRSVCYFGRPDHFTIMLSDGRGDDYRRERGVFYRPDTISPEPAGICTHHVFGRWWEFAPLDDPNCPRGFDHFTGEG